MSRRLRLSVLGIVSLVALTLTSSAFAVFTSPRLFASQPTQANRVDLLYTQSTAHDPVAKLVHYVPVAYATNLTSKRAGTQVGAAVLRGNPIDRVGNNPAGGNLVLSGVIEVRAAGDTFSVNGRQLSMSAAAAQCTGRAQQTSYWLAKLKDAGGDFTWDVPVFAERLSAATAFGADATLTTCFLAPDLAAGNANRAPSGFRVREFDLRLMGVFTAPKRGQQRWSTLATPYTPRAGTPNQAGTVELQSVLTYPRTVSLRPAVRIGLNATSATYRFSGSVATPALDRPRVTLYRGANRTQAGSPSAQAYLIKMGAGAYRKSHWVRRVAKAQTFYFQVRAHVANQVQGRAGCVANYHPNITCIQSTRAGYMIRSGTVKVTVPKR